MQELDKIVNDYFRSGDAQTQSTNDETELQEQPRADDIDEEERDDPPDQSFSSWKVRGLHCVTGGVMLLWLF